MSFQDWLKFGWLREHKTSRQEIADLFALADRDLKACQTPALVSDWQFNIAYNAALQLAATALAAAGYSAERGNHHYRTIQSLEFTLGLVPATIRKFDVFRKKRNITDYERADTRIRKLKKCENSPRRFAATSKHGFGGNIRNFCRSVIRIGVHIWPRSYFLRPA